MNPRTLTNKSHPAIIHAARHTYDWGSAAHAARLYQETAEREKEQHNIAGEMEALRWTGNSLLWSGQHQEAMRVLLEVAMCEHPQADPGSVYGAKTDCIMIALFHAPAATCEKMLAEARIYLDRIGKPQWRHRLELETSILRFRQGQFQKSATAAVQAFRLQKATIGGPSYMNFAHLKWIARPLFFLQSEASMADWAQAAEREPVMSLPDRYYQSCIRLMVTRLRRASGCEHHGLREEAQAAANKMESIRYGWDEVLEIARALMLVGNWEMLARLPLNGSCTLPAVQAAFAVEREINLLRHKLGLPMWDAELNWPSGLPTTLRTSATISAPEVNKLKAALAELASAAQLEDQRLETTFYSKAAQLRAHHAETLLRLVGLKL